jgi:hypothetical protein
MEEAAEFIEKATGKKVDLGEEDSSSTKNPLARRKTQFGPTAAEGGTSPTSPLGVRRGVSASQSARVLGGAASPGLKSLSNLKRKS